MYVYVERCLSLLGSYYPSLSLAMLRVDIFMLFCPTLSVCVFIAFFFLECSLQYLPS